jgi:hypothetical protein
MSLKGELRSMPIADVFQWIELNRKTGVLAVGLMEPEKYFCFRDGKVAFVSSKKEGERLGEFLSTNSQIDEEKLKEALFRSREDKVPFTRYLMDKKIVPREFLIVAISQLAEMLLQDILTWEHGIFEFSDGLPEIIANGPVFINTGYIVFESVRKHDESKKGEKDLEGL